MYYVRKFTNRPNYCLIKDLIDVKDVDADFLRNELSTQENTLSFWKCDDLSNVNDTVKAILLSTTAIKTSQFIVIDSKLIQEAGLVVDDKQAGKTGYKDHSDLHINICDLTYRKLEVLLNIYKKVIQETKDEYIYQKNDVKDLIKEVISQGMLNEEMLDPHLASDIKKYCT